MQNKKVILKLMTISTANFVMIKFLLSNGSYDFAIGKTEAEAIANMKKAVSAK
jgi:hypothetical protein